MTEEIKGRKTVMGIISEKIPHTMLPVVKSLQSLHSPDDAILINLEALVNIEQIFTDIIQCIKEQAFGTVFNKCTEWWDCSAQLKLNEYEVLIINAN